MHHSLIERMVEHMGCHHAQHRILFYLERNPGSPSQRDIADFMEISPACVAVTMKKMEKNGLIRRKVKIGDSRTNIIEITPKAREIINISKQYFKNIEDGIFSGFSDEEIALLEEYFERMKANIRNIDIKSITGKAECEQ
ncbi:MAG: MarR family transcriptional regulator [Clostridia bacterium]|nr:MarR family transcriptional regulator [Clostridia bacterium]